MSPGLSDGSDAPQVMPGEAPQVMHGDGALEVLTSKPENQPARTNGLDPRRRLTLCGVQRSRRFWLFAFLVSLILVSGLGVGLGVGLGNRSGEPGDLTQTSESSTSALSTATETTSAASTLSTGTTYSTGCENNGERRQYTPVNNRDSDKPFIVDGKTLEFQILCSVNYASFGDPVAPNLHITELQRIANETSIEDCITRCATFSAQLAPDALLDRMCSHVVYRIYNEGLDNMCFLQSGSTNNATSYEVEDELATAVLL